MKVRFIGDYYKVYLRRARSTTPNTMMAST